MLCFYWNPAVVVVLAVAKITVANVPAVAVVLALVVVFSSDKSFRLWDYDYWTDNFVCYWTYRTKELNHWTMDFRKHGYMNNVTYISDYLP